MLRSIVFACVLLGGSGAAFAGPEDFKKGPVFENYGAVAFVPGVEFDASTQFKVAFDVASAAEEGEINRRLESAARFINMHVAAGMPLENINLAVVVHGPAAMDLVTDDRYGSENANAGLIAALIDAGVSIQLCGQTAAYRDIAKSDLLPGVGLSLSAMTAHAELQQRGYSLNPF